MPFPFLDPSIIHVTLEYSNALLLAVLPLASDCCQKLNVPIPTPITVNQVRSFKCLAEQTPDNCSLYLTNYCLFTFHEGIMDTFCDHRHSVNGLQDNRLRPQFYGNFKMTKDQAVAMARDGLSRLGFSLEDIFADGDPCSVEVPHWQMDGTNVLPYYDITWNDARGSKSAEVEVDGQATRITEFEIHEPTAWKDPLVPRARFERKEREPSILPTNTLLSILAHYSDCENMFGPSVTVPNSAAEIASVWDKHGGKLILFSRRGDGFGIENGVLVGYNASDSFYLRTLSSPVRRYCGEWNMSEKEAVRMARQFLDKLHYWRHPCFYDKNPEIKKPVKAGLHIIPRYCISWEQDLPKRDGSMSGYIPYDEAADVEIDAGTRTVKGFAIYSSELMKRPQQ